MGILLVLSSSLDGERLELVEMVEGIAPRRERAEPQLRSGHSKTGCTVDLDYGFCLAETLSSAAASAAPSWISTVVGTAAVRLRDIQLPAHRRIMPCRNGW